MGLMSFIKEDGRKLGIGKAEATQAEGAPAPETPPAAALEQEIRHRAPLFAGRHVSQLHWGGGTPTFLSSGP